jgi:hypothetical protein
MKNARKAQLDNLWAWLICLLFALIQFRFAGEILGRQLGQSINASEGVVHGVPHWVIYQSRVLGPYILHGLSEIGLGKVWAFAAMLVVCTTLAGRIFLSLLSREFRPPYAWLGFMILQLMVATCMNKMWLYPWDFLSLVFFCLFLGLVLREAPVWQFVLLFVAALFSRESALFMALWLVLDPLCRWYLSRSEPARAEGQPQSKLDWGQMAMGAFLMGLGMTVINALRKHLLEREVGPELWNVPELAGKVVHWKYNSNLSFLSQTLTLSSSEFDFVLPWLYALALVLMWQLWRLADRRLGGLVLVHVIMLVSIFAVAVLTETRVFLELTPLLAYGCLRVLHARAGDAPAVPRA